jgi:hypothetical protein
MLTNQGLSHLWHLWVNAVGGLGLPFDRQAAAALALVFVFYGIGLAFKTLVSK